MLYLDTNILIYLFELHDPHSDRVASKLEKFGNEGDRFVTSVIAVTEFLAGTASSNLETLHKVPRLSIIALDENLAEQAAILQRKSRVQIGDSIHLATAIQQQAETFFTNDKELAKVAKEYMSVISP
jgi:predicted nucleic acid-binding protein